MRSFSSLRFLSLSALTGLALFIGCGGSESNGHDTDGGADGSIDSSIDSTLDSNTETIGDTVVDTHRPDFSSDAPVVGSNAVDLLLVVDDSSSMSDKQDLFARALPRMLHELTSPSAGRKAIVDLHVGVITTSLGSHGTSACDPSSPHSNDHGHLLPRAGESVASGYAVLPSGSVGPQSCTMPAAASPVGWTSGGDGTALEASTTCVIESAQQDGCGYEETLESTYHFLIDPTPWLKADVDCTFGTGGDACGTNKIIVSGVDSDLLAQRKAFLRESSTLAVIMLSDENDASLKPAQLNWLPWAYAKGAILRGWDNCAKVPDDFEPDSGADFATLHSTYDCKSCFEDAGNPNCSLPWGSGTNVDSDDRNLRAFQQTRRFGFNFLWGRQRYVDGFTENLVPGTDPTTGATVGMANPIFAGGKRLLGNVFVMSIVGVPQGLVQDATGEPLVMSDADWAKIISPDVTLRDAHMIESIAPRAGVPKYAGDRTIDPVNGGDRDVAGGSDLQYACIGARTLGTDATLDCTSSSDLASNPICDAGTKTQPYFKAYPGLRELRVVHDLGGQGVVASICSSSLETALVGLVDHMQPALSSP
jgi:hypothetical protein